MKLEIVSKLDAVLRDCIVNETQVVYVLTRIGKILELENDGNYPVLKFYRDWSVHTKLDRVKNKKIIKILKEFIEDKERRYCFVLHAQFCSELNEFLKNHNLKQLNKKKLDNFIHILSKVISDTPVDIKFDEPKYRISIGEPVKKGQSGLYVINVLS